MIKGETTRIESFVLQYLSWMFAANVNHFRAGDHKMVAIDFRAVDPKSGGGGVHASHTGSSRMSY